MTTKPTCRSTVSAALGLALAAAFCGPALADETERSPHFDAPPAWPEGMRPPRDATRDPIVLEAGALLRERLGRIVPDEPALQAELGLTPRRLSAETRGNIVVVRGENGELDINWEDPNQLQNALLSVVQTFYDNHRGQDPHFVTMLTTFQVRNPAAFYLPLSNDVRGIGYRHSNRRETFSSIPGLTLNGIIFMNNYRSYSGVYAPLGRFTFNQELGHRWGSFVYYQGRNGESADMLGRDCAHWSFLMHSQNSSMEGNAWRDNGNGGFTTTTSFFSFGYSQLDRYLMGFAPADAVAPWFLISGAGAWGCETPTRNGQWNPAWYPPIFGGAGQDPVSVRGTRVDIGIEDVIAAEGPRMPDYATSRKKWQMAFILAARQNDTVNDRTIEMVEELRRTWERQWERDATEPGFEGPDLITTLDGSGEPGVDPGPDPGPGPGGGNLGNPCQDLRDCDPASADQCVGTAAGVRVCTRTCESSDECPRSFCCLPSVPGPNADRYAWYCMRSDEACEDPQPDPGGAGGAGGGDGGGAGGGGAGGAGGGDGAGGEPGEGEGGAGGEPGDVAPLDAGLTGHTDDDIQVVEKNGGGSGGCTFGPAGAALPLGWLPLLAGGLLLGLRRRR